MDKPILTGFDPNAIPLAQTYLKTLPSAFDESLSFLQKLNLVINALQQIGDLSENTIEQWNLVSQWVMSDGLNASVDSKIDSMNADGTLASVINNTLFNNLQNLITNNSTAIATNLASIQSLKKQVPLWGTPEMYGAVGDGVTDDTNAIQQCLNNNRMSVFKPSASYLVTSPLSLPTNNSIMGNQAQLTVGSAWTSKNLGPSVPANTVLYIQARQPIWLSELDEISSFVRDLRIKGIANLGLTGMFLGTTDKSQVTQASVVNYSVYGKHFENIGITYVDNGIQLSEAWACTFHRIHTTHIKQTACYIAGQVVNCNYSMCSFGTSADGNYGLFMDGNTYGVGFLRPEGNMFHGGFIGEAQTGIRINTALATKFTGLIVDLNTQYAVNGTSVDDCQFTDCYLYCQGVVIGLVALSTLNNGSFITFKSCNIVTTGNNYAAYINVRQNGTQFLNCMVQNQIFFDDGCSGTVAHCLWADSQPNTAIRILHNATGIIKSYNNNFKGDGTPVPTQGTVSTL